MKIKLYQIDTFTDTVFKGNSAAVCPLDSWLDDELMQKIAAENNLSETAFIVKEEQGYRIRWFTPTLEVDLCGHATLAAAYVFYKYLDFKEGDIAFNSRSGILKVRRAADFLTLDFPADDLEKVALSESLLAPFAVKPVEAYKGKTDYLLLFENEDDIKNMSPDLLLLGQITARGIIVTAKGSQADFVSRFFAPQSGINEDPVTGSAHTTLTVYWHNVLNKTEMRAQQLSARGGDLKCIFLGDRIEISGQAVTYLIGDIEV